MIQLKSQSLRNQYSDSLSSDDSSQDVAEDRIRAIRIDEEKNLIHTFEHPSSSVIEEESQEYESSRESLSNREQSELVVSDSDNNEGRQQKRARRSKYQDKGGESELEVSQSDEDIDELQKRIRKLESNLERDLKRSSKDRPKQPLQKENKQENRNTPDAPQKLMQKQKQKVVKPKINPPKDEKPKLNLKSESQKLKQIIKVKCGKALTLRKQREELAEIRGKLPFESRLSQVQRELQLLKHIDSLQIKLRTSINQKVSEMHKEIEEASLKKTKPQSKEIKRAR